MKKTIILTLAAISLLFAACKKNSDVNKELAEDVSWDATITIYWHDDLVSVTSSDSKVMDNINISYDDLNVIVTSTTDKSIIYKLTGYSDDASFKIYSDKKFQILLSDLDLTSKTRYAINSQSKKRCYLVLEGTNSVTDYNEYPTDKEDTGSNNEDAKGAIFSEGQIEISGSGSLEINGLNKHALASDEYIAIHSGTIDIVTAKADGIHVKDSFKQEGNSNVSIKCGNDAIEVTKGKIELLAGTLTIVTGDDGIITTYGDDEQDTETIDASITLAGTNIAIKSPKGKAIYANGNITQTAGLIEIDGKKDKAITTHNNQYTITLIDDLCIITEAK